MGAAEPAVDGILGRMIEAAGERGAAGLGDPQTAARIGAVVGRLRSTGTVEKFWSCKKTYET